MHRRDFLRSAGVAAAGLAVSKPGRLFARSTASGGWRTFEVTTRVEVLKPAGTTRIWVPAALVRETPYQKTLANAFHTAGGAATLVEGAADSLGIIVAEFSAGVRPVLTVVSRIATKNYAVDLSAPRTGKQRPAAVAHFLRRGSPRQSWDTRAWALRPRT